MNIEKKSSFTPGPWRIGTPPPNGQQTIGTHHGLMVAVATTGVDMPTLANARLIAKAPEMLDMLKECLATLEYVDTHWVPVEIPDRLRKLIHEVDDD